MQQTAAEDLLAVGEGVLEELGGPSEQALVAVSIVIAILLFAVVLWSRFERTLGDEFVDAISVPEHICVLMHPNPDPDAMGSAMAVAALAKVVGTSATIQYPGEIRHPENRAFETVLDCSFERVETASELAGDEVVLVDHNEPRGFGGADFIEPYAVIDHHPGNGEGEVFTDVRPERGACASILTEYLRDRGWTNDSGGDEHAISPRLATGLLYGIQSDTTVFTRGCTPAEFEAAAFLFPAADADSLDRIANPEIDGDTLELKAKAINDRKQEGSFLVSDVDTVSNLDALPTAAEELVRLEGVTVSVVMGKADGTVHLSGRSRDDRVHMGKTLQRALGSLSDASAGGHARMGGGRVDLPVSEEVSGETVELEPRLFAAMNGEL
ncbi:DHH family phosphoesterase [Natronomonas sp.]|uniref:DHH family phosphoesterase n=1 Tax=Natronomonas sp. TaxID=2184060 RepID=UPI002FC328BF